MEALIDEPAIAWQYPRVELSFRPFVQYLKDQRRNVSSPTMDQLYAHLIDQFEEAVQSPDRLQDFFWLATVAVLPLTGTDPKVLYAFGLHIPLRVYHSSPAFDRLLLQFPNLTGKPHEHSNSLKQQQFSSTGWCSKNAIISRWNPAVNCPFDFSTTSAAGSASSFRRSRRPARSGRGISNSGRKALSDRCVDRICSGWCLRCRGARTPRKRPEKWAINWATLFYAYWSEQNLT